MLWYFYLGWIIFYKDGGCMLIFFIYVFFVGKKWERIGEYDG